MSEATLKAIAHVSAETKDALAEYAQDYRAALSLTVESVQ